MVCLRDTVYKSAGNFFSGMTMSCIMTVHLDTSNKLFCKIERLMIKLICFTFSKFFIKSPVVRCAYPLDVKCIHMYNIRTYA